MGEMGAVVGGTRCENVSRERLDINVVSYRYEGMRQEEETNLVLVEVEVGAWELDQDDFDPKPMHRGGVGDID
jgi:hypothetical protein